MKDMNSKKKKNAAIRRIVIGCILAVLVLTGAVFYRFGGFGTGGSADLEEFAAYAGQISEITIPENTRIIALGEATHGNREFQQLKLDVFQIMVEQYGVRAFAFEGDYGGCEVVNRYIHGGEGTAKEAAAAIGFAIYRTGEIFYQLLVSGLVSQQIPPDCTENRTVFLLFRSQTGDPVGVMGFRIGDGQRHSVRRLIAGFQHLV